MRKLVVSCILLSQFAGAAEVRDFEESSLKKSIHASAQSLLQVLRSTSSHQDSLLTIYDLLRGLYTGSVLEECAKNLSQVEKDDSTD